MTVIGLDDTDSRTQGMCTTYAAALVAERLRARASVERLLLVRLNPAVPYKTRGNAALAVHTDADPETAFSVAEEVVAEEAMAGDDRTNPGLVVAPGDPGAVPEAVADWSERALRELLDADDARALAADAGYRVEAWQSGQGVVGALAAVGAWRAWERDGTAPGLGDDADPTYETISYRPRDRWGTDRDVDARSVFAAADDHYPAVWDTVDRVERETVCVPHTPGPVLHGIRGDDPEATRACAAAVESEPVERRETFVTNQGTDAHLAEATVSGAREGRSYRLDATVSGAPETRRGGHVFLELRDGDATVDAAAFEPTGRFRDRVRALRVGDDLTVCGELADGTLKLEKFGVRALDRAELVTPTCPDCGRSMSSAGRNQGYRCRDCGTSAPGKVERELDRALEPGWYEVPPSARRHVAKPLVRGGFDAPTHPER
ncbi:tRNA(Ile)(2)-agmatinylcytidine synthase [Halorarius halobius]|uniref:tRNA(Ile)(2)-agmatinylcytidine synthase n=1 Tax=Halorarius halobius TaxID=2962671 RepID=UPI0020CC75C8|nr:tRNA(Ile)(2)-agmatinylcytidine synthase [Halorarius halobius]